MRFDMSKGEAGRDELVSETNQNGIEGAMVCHEFVFLANEVIFCH